MKTLYETIMQHDFIERSDFESQKLISEMGKAEVIHIQNVADYVFSGVDDKGRWEIAKDFPNLAPPFPAFWMEYVDTRGGDKSRVGFLFLSFEGGALFKSKWQMAVSWILITEGMLFQPITWIICVNDDGSVKLHPDGTPDMVVNIDQRLRPDQPGLDDLNLGDMFIAPLLAVSLMHCKNVSVISREPKVGNRKQRGRHASKIRFHTLQIEPMKRVLRQEGKAEEAGIKHALHICRGHFKDFSKGKGLFGKYKDIFWWDSQVRGSAERGAVLKDYSVEQPEVSALTQRAPDRG